MAICNIRLFTEDFFYLSLYKNTFINLIVLFANKGTFFIFLLYLCVSRTK
ncbi:conserved domain protein [Bacteroides xylanisolvens SD CC 2a]|nr:conserved domain protein [Bacteroides xylanisolvens SD CC 2a]